MWGQVSLQALLLGSGFQWTWYCGNGCVLGTCAPRSCSGRAEWGGAFHLPLTGPWLAAADAAHLSSIPLSPASCSWSPVAPPCRLSPNHMCFSLSREGSEITGPCQSQDPEGSERKRPTNCGSELHGSHSLIFSSGLRSRM